MSSAVAHALPPSILALFAPRAPIEYKPPMPGKRRKPNYGAIAHLVTEFEDPADTPPAKPILSLEETKRQRREERKVEGPSTAGTAPPANDSDSRVSRDELQTTGSSRQHRGVTMRVRMPSRRIGNLGVDRRGYGERSRVRHPSSTRARVWAEAAIMLQI